VKTVNLLTAPVAFTSEVFGLFSKYSADYSARAEDWPAEPSFCRYWDSVFDLQRKVNRSNVV